MGSTYVLQRICTVDGTLGVGVPSQLSPAVNGLNPTSDLRPRALPALRSENALDLSSFVPIACP
jgi:hypothetical protein